jgi:hypothetical protein
MGEATNYIYVMNSKDMLEVTASSSFGLVSFEFKVDRFVLGRHDAELLAKWLLDKETWR